MRSDATALIEAEGLYFKFYGTQKTAPLRKQTGRLLGTREFIVTIGAVVCSCDPISLASPTPSLPPQVNDADCGRVCQTLNGLHGTRFPAGTHACKTVFHFPPHVHPHQAFPSHLTSTSAACVSLSVCRPTSVL